MIVFGLTSDWLIKWREIFTQSQSVAMQLLSSLISEPLWRNIISMKFISCILFKFFFYKLLLCSFQTQGLGCESLLFCIFNKDGR